MMTEQELDRRRLLCALSGTPPDELRAIALRALADLGDAQRRVRVVEGLLKLCESRLYSFIDLGYDREIPLHITVCDALGLRRHPGAEARSLLDKGASDG